MINTYYLNDQNTFVDLDNLGDSPLFVEMDGYNGDEQNKILQVKNEGAEIRKNIMLRIVKNNGVETKPFYKEDAFAVNPDDNKVKYKISVESNGSFELKRPDENGLFFIAASLSPGASIKVSITALVEKGFVEIYGEKITTKNIEIETYAI